MTYEQFKALVEAFIERHYQPEVEIMYDVIDDPSKTRFLNKAVYQKYDVEPTEDRFSVLLLKLIDQAGLKDSEVYTIAGISRQHFSKMRSDPDYQPNKDTVLKLSIALKLRLDMAQKLADSAGYSISNSSQYDCVIKCCLMNKIYEPLKIDQFLAELHLKPLFSSM